MQARLPQRIFPPLLADRSFVGADPSAADFSVANAQLANILDGLWRDQYAPCRLWLHRVLSLLGPDGDAVSCAALPCMARSAAVSWRAQQVLYFANSPVAVAEGLAGAFIQPIMVTNENSELFWASSSAGGPAAVISGTYLSVGVGIASRQALSQAFAYAPTNAADTVNAMHCPSGWPSNAGACQASADPKGYGLATSSSSTIEADSGGGGIFGIDLF